MITNVVNQPAVPDPTQIKPVEPVQPVQEVAAASSGSQTENGLSNHDRAQSQPAYMLKLTIDKDPDSGEFIYRAIDRYTGEVVRQFPQKELVEMRKSISYKAGSIVRTDI
ncbi:flagellar protein FlaG [Asticcacaulis sp. DW145]|uniref:Flagellar protein FlaG n=1 Tax=Asticcacaulis currens TaxID=2984210 RepID=A0ABT5IGD7_9CAUL|nr:flagellar protein FlaG [Asticcacaulis currens]MDC7695257.1 flagellar protein FlaG [Asticcacaulis currens]BEV12614.1 flagellar protein FlaG [Asticcacaulis sp. DW145]